MPPDNSARIWSAKQEDKWGKATSSFIVGPVRAIAARPAGKRGVAKEGTLFAGLRKPTELVVIVVTLLSSGCPIQAIVHAFGLDERTVANWRDRAGQQCERVHQALVEQGQLDLVQGPPDEIRVKGRQMMVWMGLALMVSTRLWVAGAVSVSRDSRLADRLMQQGRRCAQRVQALLVCTDGWSASPNSIRKAFREKVKETAGRGRACLRVWPQLHIGTVIKHSAKKRVVAITRQMSHGMLEGATALLKASRGGTVLNTAFIERFNGTMRERLATFTRKSRHLARRLSTLQTGMYLLGCTYHFCWPHHQLSQADDEATGKRRSGPARTPALAAGLTDHVWSVWELMSYKIAPSAWVEPKRRGRPRTRPLPDPALPKQPRGRPRIRPLPDPTVPKRPPGRPRKVA